MPEKNLTVTFKVEASNALALRDKEKFIENFSKINAEDQRRISKIMANEKALAGLAENWSLLEGMFL